jgi:hypothetical protein
VSEAALAALDELLTRDDDADDILRAAAALLVGRGGCTGAEIRFAEEGGQVTGPVAGQLSGDGETVTPVLYETAEVAQLVTEGCNDHRFLDQVAGRIAVYCLVGWDTGGVPWEAS